MFVLGFIDRAVLASNGTADPKKIRIFFSFCCKIDSFDPFNNPGTGSVFSPFRALFRQRQFPDFHMRQLDKLNFVCYLSSMKAYQTEGEATAI